MPDDRCPSCQAPLTEREARERWCNECGTSLPELVTPTPAAPTAAGPEERPRRYDWAERDLSLGPTPEQAAARKQASTILFLVAALQFVCRGMVVLALSETGPRGAVAPEVLAGVVAEWVGVTLLFAGLGWWALYQPLPPAIIGLVVYVLLWLAGAVLNPAAAHQGLLVKIAVILGLARAIQAAAKAR